MTIVRRLALALALGLATATSLAASRTPGVFVQGGGGERDVYAASIGLDWPSDWRRDAGGGEWTLQWELFASRWDAPQLGGGRRTFSQVGLVPLFRWRADSGRSPLFFELGIGVSLLDQRFVSVNKTFSTRANFSDNAAVGFLFGPMDRHELSLRWQHTSNAAIKRPNPGMDLMLVRYGVRF